MMTANDNRRYLLQLILTIYTYSNVNKTMNNDNCPRNKMINLFLITYIIYINLLSSDVDFSLTLVNWLDKRKVFNNQGIQFVLYK